MSSHKPRSPSRRPQNQGLHLRHVVGLIGNAASGKTTIAAELASRLPTNAAQVIGIGAVVRAHASTSEYDKHSRESVTDIRFRLADLGEQLIQADTPAFCASVLARREPEREYVIIDGIRHLEFAQALAIQVDPAPLLLVWVDSPAAIRSQRLHTQGLDADAIQRLERHPTERTIAQWAPQAAHLRLDGSNDSAEAAETIYRRLHTR